MQYKSSWGLRQACGPFGESNIKSLIQIIEKDEDMYTRYTKTNPDQFQLEEVRAQRKELTIGPFYPAKGVSYDNSPKMAYSK